MYHAESDSFFEIDASELEALYSTYDGGLCVDKTGDPVAEARFRQKV